MTETARPMSFMSVLSTAVLVTITTAGALVGLGIRRADDTSLVFQIVGHNLLNTIGRADVATPLQASLVGYVHHLTIATLWGLALAPLVLRTRGALRALVCLLIVPLYTALAVYVLPAFFRIGHVVTSNVADVFPTAAALAVALLGGAWVSGAHGPQRHANPQ